MNYINFDLLALNNVRYGFLEDLIKSRTLYQFFFNLLLSFKPRLLRQIQNFMFYQSGSEIQLLQCWWIYCSFLSLTNWYLKKLVCFFSCTFDVLFTHDIKDSTYLSPLVFDIVFYLEVTFSCFLGQCSDRDHALYVLAVNVWI